MTTFTTEVQDPTVMTPVTASSGNVAAATATATLAASAGIKTWLAGFYVVGAGATAASVVLVTVTGLIGGTMTFPVTIPAGVALGVSFSIAFPRPIPSSAINTAVVVSVPSFGAGNTNAAVVAVGHYA